MCNCGRCYPCHNRGHILGDILRVEAMIDFASGDVSEGIADLIEAEILDEF